MLSQRLWRSFGKCSRSIPVSESKRMGKQIYQVYDYQDYLNAQKEANKQKKDFDPEQFITNLSKELGKSKEETMKIAKKLIDEKLK